MRIALGLCFSTMHPITCPMGREGREGREGGEG